jgi:hypothetical protein
MATPTSVVGGETDIAGIAQEMSFLTRYGSQASENAVTPPRGVSQS